MLDAVVGGETRAAFYRREGAAFVGCRPATGPWDKRFQSGFAISGLLGHLVEAAQAPDTLDIARYQLDIFRPAPMDGLLEAQCSTIRDGRRQHVVEATLACAGEIVARATALRLRLSDSPNLTPTEAAAPEIAEGPSMQFRSAIRPTLQSKLLYGGIDQKGPGAAWLKLDADIVEGTPITPFVAAAMTADFGSGLGSVFDWREVSFANVDISMYLMRPPSDQWIRLASETITQGRGRALVNAVLSDRFGEFARAHQTLYVEPRDDNRG